MSEILTQRQIDVKAALAREVGALPEVSVLVLCVSHEALRAEVARLQKQFLASRDQYDEMRLTLEAELREWRGYANFLAVHGIALPVSASVQHWNDRCEAVAVQKDGGQ